jgi:hypothetical protein
MRLSSNPLESMSASRSKSAESPSSEEDLAFRSVVYGFDQ